MLERTLATDFVPGSNLRGAVSGANWLFALPALRLKTVICLGMPSAAALQALVRRADRLILCARDDSAVALPAGVGHVVWRHADSLPLATGSANLIVIADQRLGRRVARTPTLQAELRRVLAADGLIYLDTRKALPSFAGLRTVSRLWLTPLVGEAHTAVPLDDRLTRRFFVARRLFSPVFTLQALKRARRHQNHAAESAIVNGEAGDRAPAAHGWKRPLARLAGRVEQALGSLEGQWYRHTGRGRVGALLSADDRVSLINPPAYLQALATQAGLSLDGYRWGLWAGGQYSSRKVLFFLFEGAQTAPRYLVKLVRDPLFNARLENEDRALQQLHANGFAAHHLLPRVAFSGCADDLYVVGETVIDGVPFLSRTTLTPACPVAQAAVAWLTDLGAHTVTWQKAAAVAGALTQLLERFQALYQLPDAERDFLVRQIAHLGETAENLPLVFQHGDPGPWNMLVAPDGRVALLDWESAEPQGMPLWDLFYFLRSYTLNVSRAGGEVNRLDGVARHFLAESPLSSWLVEAVHGYCAQIGIGTQYVEPLYYTCWMHRALKQATLLSSTRLSQGIYVQLLRRSIAERDAPALRALFATGV